MKLIDEKAVAEMLSLPLRTVQIWRIRGIGPHYIKIGRNVRYIEEDIVKFVAASRVDPSHRASSASKR